MKLPSMIITLACLLPAALAADEASLAALPHADPYLPPAARHPIANAPAGEALKAKVAQKLAKRFDEADADHTGTVTREQAMRAGWGFVAQHFDNIDVQHSGKVSLDDIRRYMRSRGAAL